MDNVIYVNGKAVEVVAWSQLRQAVNEMRKLVSDGNDPRDIEIYWMDGHHHYNDIMYADGKYIHRHEVLRMEENQICI